MTPLAAAVSGPRRNLFLGLGYPSAVAFERVAVYLYADAGVLRNPHLAVGHAHSAAYKVLAEGVRGGVVLEHRLLRVHRQRRRGQGCHELQGGGEPYARAPHVRDDGGVPRLGDGRYLLAFGEPPEEQRSGWRMSRAPSEIQRRKPVFPNRFSPAARWVSVRCLSALYPSRSSGARGSSKKWTSASRHPRRILRVAGAS